MYLMIFFWSADLRSARGKSSPGGADDDLPFGTIFSSFMCAMMCGSILFSLFARKHSRDSAAFILMCVLLVVSACLSAATLVANEYLLFWAFCVFEACIGAYFPSMSYLKSEIVEDGVRGTVYSILRFPLNVFVVLVHSLDEEGLSHQKTGV
jgi:MFS transporter, MFS domain-containing protein family, molybdate-anion transporter